MHGVSEGVEVSVVCIGMVGGDQRERLVSVYSFDCVLCVCVCVFDYALFVCVCAYVYT